MQATATLYIPNPCLCSEIRRAFRSVRLRSRAQIHSGGDKIAMPSCVSRSVATIAAKELLARMTTKGWKIRVHKTLSWHYNLVNGNLSLHPSCRKYFCLLSGNEHPGSGKGIWTDIGFFKDPNEAVRFCVNEARAVLIELIGIVEKAERIARPIPTKQPVP